MKTTIDRLKDEDRIKEYRALPFWSGEGTTLYLLAQPRVLWYTICAVFYCDR